MRCWPRKPSGEEQRQLRYGINRPSGGRAILCYVTDRKGLIGGASASATGVPELLGAIRRSIEAGVDWVQVREKDLDARELSALVRGAMEAASAASPGRREERVKIIVNDRLDVAVACGAAGVHLGRESAPVEEVVKFVRRWREAGRAGEARGFLVGVSCHSVEEARGAERDGADYLHFGPVFETPSKVKFGPAQGMQKLREVCEAVRIPVIAVGGIDERNIEECLEAGAAGVAAIRMFQKN
jgi:thiamine-phosphate pyrophosphorylase